MKYIEKYSLEIKELFQDSYHVITDGDQLVELLMSRVAKLERESLDNGMLMDAVVSLNVQIDKLEDDVDRLVSCNNEFMVENQKLVTSNRAMTSDVERLYYKAINL